MPKSKKAKRSKAVKAVPVTKSETQLSQLIGWADEATDASIASIERVMTDERVSEETREMAKLALQEANFMYFMPSNEKEERDYLLCELIAHHESELFDLMMQRADVGEELQKMELEKSIHQLVLKRASNKAQREAWEMQVSEDSLTMQRNEFDELATEIEYRETWIEEAKKSITTPKYKNLPEGYFQGMHRDEDLDEEEEGDEGCMCPECVEGDSDEV